MNRDTPGLELVRNAADVRALKIALRAGLNGCYNRFRSRLWKVNTDPAIGEDEAQRQRDKARAEWDRQRGELQAAFSERLRDLEGRDTR